MNTGKKRGAAEGGTSRHLVPNTTELSTNTKASFCPVNVRVLKTLPQRGRHHCSAVVSSHRLSGTSQDLQTDFYAK